MTDHNILTKLNVEYNLTFTSCRYQKVTFIRTCHFWGYVCTKLFKHSLLFADVSHDPPLSWVWYGISMVQQDLYHVISRPMWQGNIMHITVLGLPHTLLMLDKHYHWWMVV